MVLPILESCIANKERDPAMRIGGAVPNHVAIEQLMLPRSSPAPSRVTLLKLFLCSRVWGFPTAMYAMPNSFSYPLRSCPGR